MISQGGAPRHRRAVFFAHLRGARNLEPSADSGASTANQGRNLSRIVLAVACVAAAPLLNSCHRDRPTVAVDAKTVQQGQNQLAQAAWMRTHLPPHMVACLRVPAPWSLFGGIPDGRPLGVATASAHNLKAVATTHTAIGKNPELTAVAILAAIPILRTRMTSSGHRSART